MKTFVEVGAALARIHDEGLYQEAHESFEDYCRERWGFTKRYANNLVAGAEVGTIVPVRTESVARELAALRADPEKLTETWATVVEEHGDKPTAKQVRAVVRRQASERDEGLSAPGPKPILTPLQQRAAEKTKKRIESAVGCSCAFGQVSLMDVEQAMLVATDEEVDGWLTVLRKGRGELAALIHRIEATRGAASAVRDSQPFDGSV